MDNLDELKNDLYSNDWDLSLQAAEKLAELNTEEAVSILKEGLKSDDNYIRNAAALGIREANNEAAFQVLWSRIVELGPDEEIGTLVYSLEMADCSNYLSGMIHLYYNGNYEVEHSISFIISEQTFNLTSEELIKIKVDLKKHEMVIEDLNIKYKIINVE